MAYAGGGQRGDPGTYDERETRQGERRECQSGAPGTTRRCLRGPVATGRKRRSEAEVLRPFLIPWQRHGAADGLRRRGPALDCRKTRFENRGHDASQRDAVEVAEREQTAVQRRFDVRDEANGRFAERAAAAGLVEWMSHWSRYPAPMIAGEQCYASVCGSRAMELDHDRADRPKAGDVRT